MSVCNVYINSEGIICLTDTIKYKGDEATGLCHRKSFVSSNKEFSIGIRGSIAFIERISLYQDFPDAGLVEEALRLVPRHLDDRYFKACGGEVTLMSWDKGSDAPQAVRYAYAAGEPAQRQELEPGLHLAPKVPGAKLPQSVDGSVMVKIALAQHRVKERLNFPFCIGGIIHLTTVTRDGAEQVIAGAFPDYADHAARFGCPNSADYRLFLEQQQRAA